jgi:hypothetical protein
MGAFVGCKATSTTVSLCPQPAKTKNPITWRETDLNKAIVRDQKDYAIIL